MRGPERSGDEGMLDTEYNEAEVMELFKEEGRAEGKIEGISGTVKILIDMNVSEAEIIQKICKQYHLTEEAKNICDKELTP